MKTPCPGDLMISEPLLPVCPATTDPCNDRLPHPLVCSVFETMGSLPHCLTHPHHRPFISPPTVFYTTIPEPCSVCGRLSKNTERALARRFGNYWISHLPLLPSLFFYLTPNYFPFVFLAMWHYESHIHFIVQVSHQRHRGFHSAISLHVMMC